tara:strand:- start:2809 stop:9306 length:6498 start_codon:yes stop_codon:yes gene_type:complete
MGLIRYHGKAVRLNGLTDGLVVPTGKFRESGLDLRHPAFAATAKSPKSDAPRIGRLHEPLISNPLNTIRGAFTIDACIIPDYGGVVLEKPGQFKLTYGNPFSSGPMIFDVTTDERTYRLETTYNVPVATQSNSGTYSGGEHKPHDLTLGEQPLVMLTAQFTRQFIRCYINGDLVAEQNLAGEKPLVAEKSSDLFIGGQGGEFRGIIESIRLNRGITDPKLEPLTNNDTTLGLWLFEDDFEMPDIYFFDNARAAVTNQGRDGPDTHDGLMPLPMVAVGHTFTGDSGTTFKIRDYPANPNASVDRYTALEKLASYITGVDLKNIKNQTWYASGTLSLTDAEYFSGVASTSLNAIINHSGTHPLTGLCTSPASKMIRWADDVATASATAVDMNPMSIVPERVRITAIDFVNSKLSYTSIHLANDEQNNGVDNLPETQKPLFPPSTDALVWFVLGKSDVLIDQGNENTHASVGGQKTRAKDTFTKYTFTQNQRFSDSTEFNNDAYFISPKSRTLSSNSATVLADPADTYPAMGGVTSYTLVDGDFFLKKLPQPDEQTVKQTVQGIANSFEYISDDMSIGSIIGQNDIVKVTENVYSGGITRVTNTSSSVLATDASSVPFNRIITESGVGAYATNSFSASTRDEIVALAVEDIRPFMLKGLDTDHTAQLSNGVPTNDAYIRHLTPEKEARIAVIKSPAALVSAGGPSKVLVYYDAIDLTGEVVAGTGFNLRSGINTKLTGYHAIGNTGYLVVRKTVPCGSAYFGSKSLSEWLRKPFSSTPANHKDILFKITAPGGLISVPTASFNGTFSSHSLTASPTGDITPSPFINIEDCVVTVGTGIQGYGRPKPVPSTNTPDDTSNSEYHSLFIENIQRSKQTDYRGQTQTPASFRRSNLTGFDLIDNDLKTDESLVLVHPAKRSRFATLDDILTTRDGGSNSSTAIIELNLMKGRIEEVAPISDDMGTTQLVLRGRSILMDIADSRAIRDFNLSQGSPIKEIGDLGTPTVSLTLGGLGQGGIDIQPTYTEHPLFPGWKDRIVGSGNASVRNDKQASTYYASTRAITEIPLFPSMFFDVDSIENSDNDSRTPLSTVRSTKMSIDCTMTATNRPQMKTYESRFSIDWGMADDVASIEITDQYWDFITADTGRWISRCQRPSVQGVITNYNSGVFTLDDASAFAKSTLERGNADYCDNTFWITIGEGHPTINDGLGQLVKVTYTNATTLTRVNGIPIRHPVTLADQDSTTPNGLFTGSVATLGGYIHLGIGYVQNADGSNSSTAVTNADFIANLADVITAYNSAHGTPSSLDGYEFSKLAPLLAEEMATAACNLLGKTSSAKQQDPDNVARYLIKEGPNMEAFDWDITEVQEASADRYTDPPVIMKCSQLSLKGKKSDGSALEYVRPLELDFNDIAVKMGDFNLCVEEVIRRINMAGHPQAKNSQGGSAFDPPPLFATTNTDTGTHMGYVRAFMGKDTESRDGEAGVSIVIHSTVPGATGRNFCVHINNNTPYAYKPATVVGYGGLSANNSRAYHPNSFPAPLPIGSDGETYVPISTFRGAPHGSIHDAESNIRSYDGLGGVCKIKTVASPSVVQASDGATYTLWNGKMVFPQADVASAVSTGYISGLAVSIKTEDWMKRIGALTSASNKGIMRVKGQLADFEYISQSVGSGTSTNSFYIQKIYPREDLDSFYQIFYEDVGSASTEINNIDVEILWPRLDPNGIVFFGGGHTGVVLDISDGTANDYSSDYKHFLSKGPTGFSGFQNLHETSTASAVLDFTDITNEDTINENTLRGFHHKLVVDSSGDMVDGCRVYVRMNETVASGSHSQNNAQMTEDIYGSPIRVTGTGANFTLVNGPANSVDSADKGIQFNDGGTGEKDQCIALYNYNSGVEAEYGPMADFDCRTDFSISAFFNQGSLTNPTCGPIISGLDSNGRPWGLFLAGKNAGVNQYIQVAFCYATSSGNKKVVFNDVDRGGLRIDRDAWSCVVASKTGDNATIYLANATGLKFGGDNIGGSWDIGTVNLTGMQDITTSRKVHDGGSLSNEVNVSTTSSSSALYVAASIPSALGTTAATKMSLIGVSALKKISFGSSTTTNMIGKMYQYPYDAITSSSYVEMSHIAKKGSDGTFIDASDGTNEGRMDISDTLFFSGTLSNVAIHNYPLTQADATALWDAKGVW